MYERNYHATVLKTEEKSSKQKKRFPWKRALIIMCTLAVLGAVIALIRTPRFQVTTINVVDTNVADPIDVSQFVLDNLEGKYLWILPKSSIFLIAPDQLVQSVKAQFPRFKSVAIGRDSMHSLKVTVVEYPGAYLWCDGSDVCSFMDETGTVFADAPYFSGSAYLKVYIGARAPYPFHPISSAQMALVANLDERLKTIDIAPLSYRFESERKFVVVFIHHQDRVTITFDPTTNIEGALSTLYSGLRTEPFASMYRSQQNILRYIDLRFVNKLIYKFD